LWTAMERPWSFGFGDRETFLRDDPVAGSVAVMDSALCRLWPNGASARVPGDDVIGKVERVAHRSARHRA